MKRTFKKTLFTLLAVVTMTVIFCFGASALEPTGKCGDNVYWDYNSSTKELVISGSGAMWDFYYYNYLDRRYSPFYGSDIKSVVIKSGVTTIDDQAFDSCDSLQSITIPDSVTTIGYCAFDSCDSLQSVTVDKNNKYYCNDNYGVLFDKNKTKLIQYPIGNKRTAYTIPDSVTTIGSYAFWSCYSLQSITIPDSVTAIGYSAFYGSAYYNNENNWSDGVLYINSHIIDVKEYVESVTIKQETKTIADYAFSSCDSLQSVTIGGSVTTIGSYAFAWCDSLQSVTIPESVTTIGDDAFLFCTNLQSVTVDKNSKYFCNDEHGVLFDKNKNKLIQYPIGNKRTEYIIPDNVTTIGDDAFRDCDSLQSITIPDSVTTIGNSAFAGTAWYNNQPDGLIYIGKVAYKYKGTMPENTSITIKAGTKEIAGSAFYYCHSLKSITIPDSVTTIGDYAFELCSELTYVTISNGVKKIGENAFHSCKKLSNIYIPACVTEIGKKAFGYTYYEIGEGVEAETTYTPFEIKGAKGSAAEKYAKDNGFKFVEHTTHTHSYTAKVVTPATLTANGKAEYKCSCGDIQKTETIAKVASLTLSKTKYIYDGKNKTPKVTIKDSEGKVLTKNVDYKLVVASKRAGIGRYTVKVTFMGNYSGTKNLYFYILPGKPTTVKSTSQGTTSNKLTWSAVPGATGYTLYYYSNSKKAYKKINTTTNTTYTVRGLLTGTKYTIKIVAYGTTAAGKVYDSETYALLKSATKTKTPELTSTRASSSKGKAYVYHTDVKGETGYTVYYSTSSTTGFKKYANFGADTTMATITGLTSGKTYYFKVRTYIKTDSGYVYSPWSAVKGVKVK